MVFAAVAVDPHSNFVMSHHYCKDNCQEHSHRLPQGTDTEAHRMANLKSQHLDQFLSALLFVVVAHRSPFPMSQASLGHFPEHLAEIVAVSLGILADRSRLLVEKCRMDTGNLGQVSSDVLALALALVDLGAQQELA